MLYERLSLDFNLTFRSFLRLQQYNYDWKKNVIDFQRLINNIWIHIAVHKFKKKATLNPFLFSIKYFGVGQSGYLRLLKALLDYNCDWK